MALRIRRGTDLQRSTITFQGGEIIWVTDTGKLYVGDGITQGARSIIENYAGDGLSYDVDNDTLKLDTLNLTTDDISQGSTNLYFSNVAAQNATAALLSNGTHVGISYIYDNTPLNPKINSTVTISSEVIQDAVGPMFVNGSHSGITFTYNDNGLGNGVINANVSVDPEDVQDAINDLIVAGTHVGITIAYDDGNDKLSFSIDDGYIEDLVGGVVGGGSQTNGILSDYDQITSVANFSIDDEYVQDLVFDLLRYATHSGLSVSYDDDPLDNLPRITFTVDPTILAQDTTPELGGNLDLDGFDITGTGNIDILGDITAAGSSSSGDYTVLEGSIMSGNIIKLKGNHTKVYLSLIHI